MNAVLRRLVAASTLGALLALPAGAMETGRSDLVFASELSTEGFEPFDVNPIGKTLFGMKKGSEAYLCFLADSASLQAERQESLLAYIRGESTERDVPNIPVICVLVR